MRSVQWLLATIAICVLAGMVGALVVPVDRSGATAEGITLFLVIGPFLIAAGSLPHVVPVWLISLLAEQGLSRLFGPRRPRLQAGLQAVLCLALGAASFMWIPSPLLLAAPGFVGVVAVACGSGALIARSQVPGASWAMLAIIILGSVLALAGGAIVTKLIM